MADDTTINNSNMAEPNQLFKDHVANDNRKMRRIIAEDPEWNLMTVPLLSELCTKAIVENFRTHPRHDELPLKYRKKVLQAIPTNLPLSITSSLINHQDYWKRCCQAKWKVCDVTKFGNDWKRMYFERELKFLIENFVPNKSDMSKINEILRLGADYIIKLDIQQLLPPIELEKKEFNLDKEEEEEDDERDELKEKYECDHFDFNQVIPFLHKLEEIKLVYGVRDCGMNFEWQLFDFTKKDCQSLSKCLAQFSNIKSLHLNWSKIDDDKVRLFISQILNHPSLTELDLSHNLISDRGCRAIGKFLNGHSKLESLNLCNNQIRGQGGQAIAHALTKNSVLKYLDFRLNRLGDEGGQAIAKALCKNSTLIRLNLSSNNLSEPTAILIASVIPQNKTLKYLDLSSNRLGPVSCFFYNSY